MKGFSLKSRDPSFLKVIKKRNDESKEGVCRKEKVLANRKVK
jgi:hypothetical protein